VSNRELIGNCLWRVDWRRHRWRNVTIWHHICDITIFKVDAFGK